VRRNVEFRQAQKAFIERGPASAKAARKSRKCVSAAAIVKAIEVLEVFPFYCRKAIGGSGRPFLRELLIPFGGSGYVAPGV